MKVLLFSGGIDSTALAWMRRPDVLMRLDYGQKAADGEARASRIIAEELGLPLDERRIDLSAFGRGAMAGRAPVGNLPPENWPYRNQMLVTLAAMAYADAEVSEIVVGTVVTDRVHPDGRPAFMMAIDAVVRSQSGPRILTPASGMSSLELVRASGVPRGLLGWTFSCHTGPWACGRCRGCVKHDELISSLGASEGETDP